MSKKLEQLREEVARRQKQLDDWDAEHGDKVAKLRGKAERLGEIEEKARMAKHKEEKAALVRIGWDAEACKRQLGHWAGFTDEDLDNDEHLDKRTGGRWKQPDSLISPFVRAVREQLLSKDAALNDAIRAHEKARKAEEAVDRELWPFERARSTLSRSAERLQGDLREEEEKVKAREAKKRRPKLVPSAEEAADAKAEKETLKRCRAARKKLRDAAPNSHFRERVAPKGFTYVPPKGKKGKVAS